MTDSTLPLVSILIPSYKPEHFEIALTSALAQVYPRIEILVSDDCPGDGIAQICARYPRVLYSRNPQPGGRNNIGWNNVSRLFSLARGEFIKYLFDDDLLHPLCVHQMIDGFRAAPTAKLAFSPRDLIDSDSRITQRPRFFDAKSPGALISGDKIVRRCMMEVVNCIGEFSTVMFRKSDIQVADGKPRFFEYQGVPIYGLSDLATWLQLCDAGDAIYLAEPLSYFRIHAGGNTSAVQSANYRACVTDWVLLAQIACRDPRFTSADRLAMLQRVRAHLAKRLAIIPDLATELRQVDEMASDLSASSV